MIEKQCQRFNNAGGPFHPTSPDPRCPPKIHPKFAHIELPKLSALYSAHGVRTVSIRFCTSILLQWCWCARASKGTFSRLEGGTRSLDSTCSDQNDEMIQVFNFFSAVDLVEPGRTQDDCRRLNESDTYVSYSFVLHMLLLLLLLVVVVVVPLLAVGDQRGVSTACTGVTFICANTLSSCPFRAVLKTIGSIFIAQQRHEGSCPPPALFHRTISKFSVYTYFELYSWTSSACSSRRICRL